MPVIAVPGGSRKEILDLAQRTKAELPNMNFMIFDTAPNIDREGLWTYISCDNEAEMVTMAVQSVAQGQADILLKGGVKTHTLLKEVLKKEYGLRSQAVLSHVAYIEMPGLNRPVLLSDSAMNIHPNEEQLSQIIHNAIAAGKKAGITQPKVAILSSAENFNPKMASSVIAMKMTERFNNHPSAVVYGPLSFDLALSKEAVNLKGFSGPIQGDADILIVPNIDVGNVLYKSLMLFAEAKVGGTIVGAKVPIVLTSRSDTAENKMHALKFALMQMEAKVGEN